MFGKQIETIKLENYFELKVWDRSRLVAGDRWLVRLDARLDIPIKGSFINDLDEKEHILSILKQEYGDKIQYRYNQERHFIDHKEKDKLFQTFLNNFKKNIVPYLSHPEIAKKLFLLKYRELKIKAPWLFH